MITEDRLKYIESYWRPCEIRNWGILGQAASDTSELVAAVRELQSMLQISEQLYEEKQKEVLKLSADIQAASLGEAAAVSRADVLERRLKQREDSIAVLHGRLERAEAQLEATANVTKILEENAKLKQTMERRVRAAIRGKDHAISNFKAEIRAWIERLP